MIKYYKTQKTGFTVVSICYYDEMHVFNDESYYEAYESQ